jgi:hypothetical protein
VRNCQQLQYSKACQRLRYSLQLTKQTLADTGSCCDSYYYNSSYRSERYSSTCAASYRVFQGLAAVVQQQLNPEVPLAVLSCSDLLHACSHALTLVPALLLLLAMYPLCCYQYSNSVCV